MSARFKSSLLGSLTINIGVLNVQLGTNVEETNDVFEINIIMWALGTQSQDGLNLTAGFKRALV